MNMPKTISGGHGHSGTRRNAIAAPHLCASSTQQRSGAEAVMRVISRDAHRRTVLLKRAIPIPFHLLFIVQT
jgi:hypothetical protein